MSLLWPTYFPDPPEHSKNVIENYNPWDLWTTKTHISFFGTESLLPFTDY